MRVELLGLDNYVDRQRIVSTQSGQYAPVDEPFSGVRAVLESVTLADLAAGALPESVVEILADPGAELAT